MSEIPGPRDADGRPQDYVPGRDNARFDNGYDNAYGRGEAYDEFDSAPQQRGGFSAFPFPSYSTTTRGGTGITVAGCCLPLPLGCLTLTLSAAGYASYRMLRTRL